MNIKQTFQHQQTTFVSYAECARTQWMRLVVGAIVFPSRTLLRTAQGLSKCLRINTLTNKHTKNPMGVKVVRIFHHAMFDRMVAQSLARMRRKFCLLLVAQRVEAGTHKNEANNKLALFYSLYFCFAMAMELTALLFAEALEGKVLSARRKRVLGEGSVAP